MVECTGGVQGADGCDFQHLEAKTVTRVMKRFMDLEIVRAVLKTTVSAGYGRLEVRSPGQDTEILGSVAGLLIHDV